MTFSDMKIAIRPSSIDDVECISHGSNVSHGGEDALAAFVLFF